VVNGINNIFTVRWEKTLFECRIKGKILKNTEGDYNPLAAGDEVLFSGDSNSPGTGTVLSRVERRNALVRWNKKGCAPQTIAANLDLLLCVASPVSPPFRPRFIDRLLVAAGVYNITALICLNKTDQGTTEAITERIGDYKKKGVETVFVSALTGAGIEELKNRLRGKRAALVGHSGVGKTSILNRLDPGISRRVGKISEKYNRGRHTTVLAHLEDWEEGSEIIDTPGVREFDVHGVAAGDLRFYFPEFSTHAESCLFGGCTHTHEPGCAVKVAVEAEEILFDRYESYFRLFEDLKRREKRSP
jgi:ribosome biogenesis GTPase